MRVRVPSWVWLSGLLVGVVLSRWPLLGWGYGSDDDAWRNAVAGVHIRALGHYLPSRAPGFPVFETIVAALVPGGWTATNGAAILAEVVAVALFFALAERLRVRSPRWLTLAFAFCGAMWVATSQTMDYAFGIALLLAVYLSLLSRRPLWAGVLLALAAGCRISNAALVVSAVLLLLLRGDGWRAGARVAGAFAAVATLLFLPVALAPGGGRAPADAIYHIGRAHVTFGNLASVLRQALVFCLGKLGAIVPALGLAGAAYARLRRPRPQPPRDPSRRAAVAFEASAVALVGANFLLVPYESAYLLPALPFAMLLLGRLLARGWIAAWAAVLALESVALPLFDVQRVIPGRLFLELRQRREDVVETRRIAGLRPPRPTVYVVGRFRVHRLLLLEPQLERLPAAWAPFTGPGLALVHPAVRVGYAATLTPAQADSLQTAGYDIQTWPTPGTPKL